MTMSCSQCEKTLATYRNAQRRAQYDQLPSSIQCKPQCNHQTATVNIDLRCELIWGDTGLFQYALTFARPRKAVLTIQLELSACFFFTKVAIFFQVNNTYSKRANQICKYKILLILKKFLSKAQIFCRGNLVCKATKFLLCECVEIFHLFTTGGSVTAFIRKVNLH